ncbi:sugar 3,4-ketoisomerase [Cognataquiflexum aquatile]|uniref:sugar 3,4-ketoisomerase n=1 Tax=Cognataquiflexum aquatile TaxID=2249427 RepID=UPI000DE942ED|nr:FdtA/QdtA family cupin domain-containing protein [Cognataquiflexum aquatile]
MTKISLCKYIPFKASQLDSSRLVVANQGIEIQFPIQRIYYLTGVKPCETRGNHANLKNRQVMIAISGSFSVTVDDGVDKKTFLVNSSSEGLYIPEKTWRIVHDFSPEAICLVICSEKYDASDYIKDYDQYIRLKS